MAYLLKFVLLTTGLLSSLFSHLLFSADWQTAEPMPLPRQEIYVAVAGGHIYVPGGILEDGSAFSAVMERFDTATGAWQLVAPLPQARHHITPAIVDHTLYAIGGFSGGFPDWIMHNDVFEYDLKSDTWATGTSLPGPLGEHVQAVVNNRIHVIGGRMPGKEGAKAFNDYIDSTTHWIYDPGLGTWLNGNPAPTARNSAAAAVHNGLIYVVGGRRNVIRDDGTQIQVNLTNLEVYDAVGDSWSILAPMPLASGGLAAATLNGKIYVFGGEQWAPEQKVFASSWEYDIENDLWSALPDLPTARHGLAAIAVNDAVYVIGGCKITGGGAATGVVEVLVP